MSDRQRWLEANDAYLERALEWLRLRLERLAAAESRVWSESATPVGPSGIAPTSSEQEAPADSKESLRNRLFGSRTTPGTRRALPSRIVPSEEDVRRAETAMREAGQIDPPPALLRVSRDLGLSDFERNVLLLCAAREMDPGVAELYAKAQGNQGRGWATFSLAMAVFEESSWEVLSPQRPLRYWRLVEITQPGAEPLSTSALRADERIVNLLNGLEYLDDRLTPFLAPFDPGIDAAIANSENEVLPPSHEKVVAEIVQLLGTAVERREPPLVHLAGVDPEGRQLVARAAAIRLELNLYRLPAEGIPANTAELDNLARLWERESLLLPVALYLEVGEEPGDSRAEGAQDGGIRRVERFLARSGGIFIVSTRSAVSGHSGVPAGTQALEVRRPTRIEQRSAWTEVLGSEGGESPGLLAGQFDLNAHTIRDLARSAAVKRLGGDPEESRIELHDVLWDMCLSRTVPRMERLAQRIIPVASWDDLVLPEEQRSLLRELGAQVSHRVTVYDEWGFRDRMSRGLGISALFAGESGTGKTMAAEVIAHELRLHLYRIDLSAVVSKYIGETEKNLRSLFDAAEDGGAILFFDEADSLFGKRSEVKDSHDRYANIEVNYLLQRMESYRGLAILATNMMSALDSAFLRRIRFIVRFPFPQKLQREAIWRGAWPAGTPLGRIDYRRLARLNLTGGSISNIALNAAFLAARKGQEVDMPLVLASVRTELGKLERPIRDADLRWEDADGTDLTAMAVLGADRALHVDEF